MSRKSKSIPLHIHALISQLILSRNQIVLFRKSSSRLTLSYIMLVAFSNSANAVSASSKSCLHGISFLIGILYSFMSILLSFIRIFISQGGCTLHFPYQIMCNYLTQSIIICCIVVFVSLLFYNFTTPY